MGKATNVKLGRCIQRVHANKSQLKILEKMERGAYTGTAQIFWVPPIISGTDKATNFKFCTHILSVDQNNSPLKISGAVAGCVVRTLKTSKCTHILCASRGLLCDSYAVLLLHDLVFRSTAVRTGVPRCVVLPNIDGLGYGFTLREIVRGICYCVYFITLSGRPASRM